MQETRRALARRGLLLGTALGLLAALYLGIVPKLPDSSPLRRYLANHPIEQWTVALFLIGVAMLVDRALQTFSERKALRWLRRNGVGSDRGSNGLVEQVRRGLPPSVARSLAGRRAAELLRADGSPRARDEYLELVRDLAELDAQALERRGTGLRFITWAIPIFGFLGTVLGITAAIAHVTPEQLQRSLSEVTGGLAVAFDTTALALALSVVLMAGNFAVDRFERATLAEADGFARFQLAGLLSDPRGSDPVVHRVEQVTAAVMEATQRAWDQQRQAWSETVQHVAEAQVRMLQEAVSRTLEQLRLHAVRQQEQWGQAVEAGCNQLGAQIAQATNALSSQLQRTAQSLADALHGATQQSQQQLGLLHDALAAHAERLNSYIGQLQAAGATARDVMQRLEQVARSFVAMTDKAEQLSQLQRTLAQNIEFLVQSGKLDETLNTLTAAVHLLTARTASTGIGPGTPHREAA